ncbi:NAD(P)H dehydrogenase (quinone) 2 (EC [Amycolatopsis camponoti]|uniref:NAD(P)H dehydrogenase (Quinone) 2 (EC) n=1 Tax=Amycolatopsis camponoti TaxID=2606593 RepID=A0A6I8LMY4_9PSEU|nr:SDR family oxidoreductase [Amycolatopsis camponoti]VVJ18253.1 NAD(P)H dehydrogenase (quinone) 2 (EC [Amycolatopsis camponoti]
MIVVTGATGQLGRLVVEGLLEKVAPAEIVAAVRDPAKAAEFATRGVQVRRADYDDPASLAAAFAGADKVLLISSSTPGQRLAQHEAVIAAAREAGAGHLAYTSVLAADTTKLFVAPDHKATEEAIRASGLPFTFLRNGWYTENYAQTIAQALASGSFAGSAGDGKLGAVPRADFAAAAVEVLTGEGHEGRVYELAGDEPFGYADLAATITAVSGTPVTYQDLPAEQHRQLLVGAGLPEPVAAMLVDADRGIAEGELASTSGDLSRLIGRPTTSLTEAVTALVKG